MTYLELLWSFLQIGLFSFGGGYAALPLIQSSIVDTYHWMNLSEFTDLITISQMTPGPISINAATFVGLRVAGLPGALICTFGCVLPACILVTLLAYIYQKYKSMDQIKSVLGGLRPGATALIAYAGLTIVIEAFWGGSGFSLNYRSIDYRAILIFAAALFALRKLKTRSVFVILGAGLLGLLYLL
jgi:chromate transporter